MGLKASTVRRITQVGVLVMAYVGLMLYRHTVLSGYRVQGCDAGAFSIVLGAIAPRPASHWQSTSPYTLLSPRSASAQVQIRAGRCSSRTT